MRKHSHHSHGRHHLSHADEVKGGHHSHRGHHSKGEHMAHHKPVKHHHSHDPHHSTHEHMAHHKMHHTRHHHDDHHMYNETPSHMHQMDQFEHMGDMSPSVDNYQQPSQSYSQEQFGRTLDYMGRQDRFQDNMARDVRKQAYRGRYS